MKALVVAGILFVAVIIGMVVAPQITDGVARVAEAKAISDVAQIGQVQAYTLSAVVCVMPFLSLLVVAGSLYLVVQMYMWMRAGQQKTTRTLPVVRKQYAGQIMAPTSRRSLPEPSMDYSPYMVLGQATEDTYACEDDNDYSASLLKHFLGDGS